METRVKHKALLYILDGDVVEANPRVRLETFDYFNSDITFYERLWNPEVMSGNYIVQNTFFARAFLRFWTRFFYKQPPGFSSADNGALHAALALFARARPDVASPCETGYANLTTDVTNLTLYFKWIKTCRNILQPDSFLEGIINKTRGKIFIAKKGTCFVADGAFLGWSINKNAGYPPLYHGIKDKHDLKSDNNGCWVINKTKKINE